MATAGQFGQEKFDTREQAKSADLNRIGRLESRMLQEFARHLFSFGGTLAHVNAVLDGLHVTPTAGTTITVNEGLGFLFSTANLPTDNSLYPYQPFGIDDLSGANSVFTLNTALGGGNEQTYRVEIAPDTIGIETQTVQVLDVNGQLSSDSFAKRTVLRSLNGTTLLASPGAIAPLGTSTPPAATAGFVTLAFVTVHDGDANSGLFTIVDKRPMLTVSPRLLGAPWAMGRVRSDGTGEGNIVTSDAVAATCTRIGVGQYRVTFLAPPPDARYYVRLQLYRGANTATCPATLAVNPEVSSNGVPKGIASFDVWAWNTADALEDFGDDAAILDGFDFFVHLTPTP